MSTPSDPLGLRPQRDIVLVHGGWHGGWVWARLTPILSAAGHRVHAPTLTGLGDRADEFSAEVGLQTHVNDIVQCVLGKDLRAVVLLGHSYGGSIITAVADAVPERIDTLVYLDAIMPTDGIPGWEGFPPERQRSMWSGAQQLGGLRVPPPDPSIWGFVPGTADYELLQQRLTPHPIKTMMDVPRLSGRWRDVRHKFYLLAGGPPASRFSGVHAALSAEPDWTTAVVSGGHEMMWTHPQELATTLLPIVVPGEVST